MKGEVSKIGQDGKAPAPMQEVEFALILARMINTVKEDPAQMRIAVYEFARSKLKDEISWADPKERARLLAAFETAVTGVEDFSVRGDQKARLNGPAPAQPAPAAIPKPASMALRPKPPAVLEPPPVIPGPSSAPLHRQTKALMSTWFRFAAGLFLVGIAVAAAIYHQRGSLMGGAAKAPLQTASAPAKPPADLQVAAVSSQPAAATLASPQPSLPLPGVYGVFVVNNGALTELDLLSEQVPDKRVAMSTPVNKPSRTVFPDGHVKFILYRRDLVANAPDRVDVRVVARVARAMTFDARGRGSFSPVADAWNIRNVAYEFRVRPVPGNSEMLLVQPENADFELPAGRYVLALKNQGYDFSVAGKITDPSQCLERTDAANGSFYSPCDKDAK